MSFPGEIPDFFEGRKAKMKAYNLHGIGNLQFENVILPVSEGRKVLVHTRAAGICGSDIPRVYETGTYHFPTIIGHEFSGEVADVCVDALPEDAAWIGKRVGVFPLIPCMECEQCRKGHYEMCEHYSYLGSRENGGMAAFVWVPVWNLIELPDNVSYEQAAMLEPMGVAVHAIRRCLPEAVSVSPDASMTSSGDLSGVPSRDRNLSIAVCGMGTIGHLVSMFLKVFGYQNVTELRRGDIPEENTFDVFFDCVGSLEVVLEGINSLAPGGRLQLIGNPGGDMNLPKDIYWKILRKQLTLTGSWNSSFTHEDSDDWHVVLELLSKGRIHPENYISHRFPMEDGSLLEGFELMRTKREPYVKVMGEW